MSFPQQVADKALAACGRCCCICHKFCGTKMELHHIKQRAFGGEDTFENCIPLCFNCHSDMGQADPKHPKGKHYNENELKMHRDNWYKRVQQNWSFNRVCRSDIKQFEVICEVLQKAKYWLTEYDMGDPIPQNKLESLFELYYQEEDPFKEFIDPDLEVARKELLSQIKNFHAKFSQYTFPQELTIGDCWVSHMWLADHGEIPMPEDEKKKSFEQEIDELNSLAAKTWDSYKEFVRQVRFCIEKSEKFANAEVLPDGE